jgi:hypothetical protein
MSAHPQGAQGEHRIVTRLQQSEISGGNKKFQENEETGLTLPREYDERPFPDANKGRNEVIAEGKKGVDTG